MEIRFGKGFPERYVPRADEWTSGRPRCLRAPEFIHGIHIEQIARIGPEFIQRGKQAPPTFFGTLAESEHPVTAVTQVIRDFFSGSSPSAASVLSLLLVRAWKK